MNRCFETTVIATVVWNLVALGVAATVGSSNMPGFALAGAGETAPQEGTDYPDFVVSGATKYIYLVFGGDYDSDDWADWTNDVYYLKFGYSTEADGLWLGFGVGAARDVTGDGETHQDVLIGDLHYLDIVDPDDAMGKAWLVHDVVYTTQQPTITLSAGGGSPYCELTEISSDQAGNWFGYSLGWAGNVNLADEDDFVVGACLWDDTTNSKTDAGAAYIFLGDDSMPNSLDTDDGIAFTGENEYDHFGCAVAGTQA